MSAAITAVALIAVGGALSAASSARQGRAARSQANYMAAQSARQGELIQKQKEKQSELDQNAMASQFQTHSQQGLEIIAKQRASIAAGGGSNQGSGSEIILDTKKKLAADEAMIRYNAGLGAWSLNEEGKQANWAGKVQSLEYASQGKQAKTAADINVTSSLLAGASSAAGSYASNKTTTTKTKTTTT